MQNINKLFFFSSIKNCSWRLFLLFPFLFSFNFSFVGFDSLGMVDMFMFLFLFLFSFLLLKWHMLAHNRCVEKHVMIFFSALVFSTCSIRFYVFNDLHGKSNNFHVTYTEQSNPMLKLFQLKFIREKKAVAFVPCVCLCVCVSVSECYHCSAKYVHPVDLLVIQWVNNFHTKRNLAHIWWHSCRHSFFCLLFKWIDLTIATRNTIGK